MKKLSVVSVINPSRTKFYFQFSSFNSLRHCLFKSIYICLPFFITFGIVLCHAQFFFDISTQIFIFCLPFLCFWILIDNSFQILNHCFFTLSTELTHIFKINLCFFIQ